MIHHDSDSDHWICQLPWALAAKPLTSVLRSDKSKEGGGVNQTPSPRIGMGGPAVHRLFHHAVGARLGSVLNGQVHCTFQVQTVGIQVQTIRSGWTKQRAPGLEGSC